MTLEVCASGLRVRMNRFHSPFCAPFFIPWVALSVRTSVGRIWITVTLQFGQTRAARFTAPLEFAQLLEQRTSSAPMLQ